MMVTMINAYKSVEIEGKLRRISSEKTKKKTNGKQDENLMKVHFAQKNYRKKISQQIVFESQVQSADICFECVCVRCIETRGRVEQRKLFFSLFTTAIIIIFGAMPQRYIVVPAFFIFVLTVVLNVNVENGIRVTLCGYIIFIFITNRLQNI